MSLNEAEPIVIERTYLDVPVFGLREGTALTRCEGVGHGSGRVGPAPAHSALVARATRLRSLRRERPSSLPRPDRMDETLDMYALHGTKVARIEGPAIRVRHQQEF